MNFKEWLIRFAIITGTAAALNASGSAPDKPAVPDKQQAVVYVGIKNPETDATVVMECRPLSQQELELLR